MRNFASTSLYGCLAFQSYVICFIAFPAVYVHGKSLAFFATSSFHPLVNASLVVLVVAHEISIHNKRFAFSRGLCDDN